ncbi:MAG: Oligopeptide/dipeptide ABC transporter ATP-binding protein [Lachnoclostridium sp.]|jgi:oligopeptide/dipeptide ABC transporter ATP-binding protein
MTGDILQVEQVTNYYSDNGLGIVSKREKRKVLDNVSFTVHRNEFFGLVGESGCGKSTLGKAILGLIPFEGQIKVDGISYSRKNRKQFAKNIQAVFQDPLSALDPKKTIGFTLEEPLKVHHIGTKAERMKKVNEILELIGLDASYIKRYPKELSGGQRQRVCIGAALMVNPKLIIADEAVSALDVSVGSQILNLLRDIHEKRELSLLFISHNLNVVYYLCDRIAVMYRGQIVEMGKADEIYNRPLHPYTKLLLSSIPDIEKNLFDNKKDRKLPETERDDIPDGCRFYHRCPFAIDKCRGAQELSNMADAKKEEHLVRCHLAGQIK